MNIGKNFLSFNLFSSLNRNLSEGVLPQAASINNVLQAASSNNVNSVIKDKYIDEYIDEYIPSATSSVTTKNKIEINKTGASQEEDKPTVAELEKTLISFLKKNSTLSYNLMSLEIDGEGKFIAGDHVMFHINENSEGNAELIQQYLDELNSIKVGDKSLGEAFLEAYADEFGIDLDAAKVEGQEIKSLQFNFAHGVVGDEFVSQSTSQNLHIENTFYAVDEKTQEKMSISGTVGVKLGKMQSDLRAEQEVKMKELESKPKESISFKPTSLMTSMFNTLNVSSFMSDMMKDLNSMLLERTITRVLDAYNVELKEGDRISMSLNGKGEFSINANDSSIWGASGEEIEGLCYNLEKALNKAQTEDGKSLGKTLLEQFAVDMGFDSAEARKDKNFSISFSFRYNSEIGKNEIFGERLAKINSLLDSLSAQQENRKSEDNESEDELSIPSQLDTKLDTNKPEEEIDQILKK